jgi:hypothetical protein
VIVKHLASAGTDPINDEPLNVEDLIAIQSRARAKGAVAPTDCHRTGTHGTRLAQRPSLAFRAHRQPPACLP